MDAIREHYYVSLINEAYTEANHNTEAFRRRVGEIWVKHVIFEISYGARTSDLTAFKKLFNRSVAEHLGNGWNLAHCLDMFRKSNPLGKYGAMHHLTKQNA